MNRKAKAAEWFQKVILRGIEGLLSDKYLEQAIKSSDITASDAFRNQFESKCMAEQLYAQLQGRGL